MPKTTTSAGIHDATTYKNYENELDRAYGVLGSHDYFQQLKAQALNRILDRLAPDGEQLRVLDVGAGTATLLKRLPRRHLRIGIDPDAEMIGQVPLGKKDYSIVNASGLQMPFPGGSFDVVYLADVLHHVPENDRVQLLSECARTLNQRGVLVVFEHNPYNLPVVLFLKAFVKIDRDARFLTSRRLTNVVTQAGLKPRSTAYMCFFPGFLKALSRLEKYISWLPFGGQYCFVASKGRTASIETI